MAAAATARKREWPSAEAALALGGLRVSLQGPWNLGNDFWNDFGYLYAKMLMSKVRPNFVTKMGQAAQLPFSKPGECFLSPGM